MDLSAQNKKFLSHLRKLGIDLNQFPDKSFDGLFDNVSNDMNHFFDWFMENITPENVLTKLEEASYFEMERNGSLLSDHEVSHLLANSTETFDECLHLDVNHVKTILPEELENLKTDEQSLLKVLQKVELKQNKIKNALKDIKEKINFDKKQLEMNSETCKKINSSVCNNVDDLKSFLLKNQNIQLNGEDYKVLLKEEESIHGRINDALETQMINPSEMVQLLPELEETLSNVEIASVLSKGILESKRAQMKTLDQFIEDVPPDSPLDTPRKLFISPEKCDKENMTKLVNEIKSLEVALFRKIKLISLMEVDQIANEYFIQKTDINNRLLGKLEEIKKRVHINSINNSWLYHILQNIFESLEKNKINREECLEKLNQYRVTLYNSVRNLELKKKKFDEVSSRYPNEHPFVVALKKAGYINDDKTVSEDSTLNKLFKLLEETIDNSEEIKLMNDIESTMKGIMSEYLCGPTSQILKLPVELMIKNQKCQRYHEELSRDVKRLLNEYLETKVLLAKSDRKGLLLWTKFLTSPKELEYLLEES